MQASGVQHAPDVATVGYQVAAVEADGNQLVSELLPRLAGDLDRGVDGLADIVGIEEQGVLRQGGGDRLERLPLGVVQLHERVGDRAGGLEVEPLGGRDE